MNKIKISNILTILTISTICLFTGIGVVYSAELNVGYSGLTGSTDLINVVGGTSTGSLLKAGNTSYPNAFIINSSGNVGIGITNPTYKLYVNGTSYFNDTLTLRSGYNKPQKNYFKNDDFDSFINIDDNMTIVEIGEALGMSIANMTKVDDSTAPAPGAFEVSGYRGMDSSIFLKVDQDSEYIFETWIKVMSSTADPQRFYAGWTMYNSAKSSFGNTQRYWGSAGTHYDSNSYNDGQWHHVLARISGVGSSSGNFIDGTEYAKLVLLFNYSSGDTVTRYAGMKLYKSKRVFTSIYVPTSQQAVDSYGKLIIDYSGNVYANNLAVDVNATVTGTLTAGAFSGPLAGTVSSANVSSGAFGSNTGGGNYSFPSNLGIGTTVPTAPLHVNKSGSGQTIVAGLSSTSLRPVLQFSESSGISIASGMSIEYNGVGGGDSNMMHINNITGAPVFTVTSGGNVGIGTTNPGDRLDLGGGASGINMRIGVYTALGEMYSSGGTVIGDNVRVIPGVNSMGIMTTHASLGARAIKMVDEEGITFHTIDGSVTSGNTYSSERMRIAETGNVGIGTTSPGAALDVNGSILVSRSDGTGTLEFTNLGNAEDGRIIFRKGVDSFAVGAEIRGYSAGSYNRKGLSFYTGDYGDYSTDAVEVMRINEKGNVGIGTTSPGAKLQIHDSSTNADLYLTDGTLGEAYGGVIRGYGIGGSGGRLQLGTLDNDIYYPALTILEQGGNVGIGTTNPSTKLEVAGDITAVGFLYSSDRRLKENIYTLNNALDKIGKLEGVSFNWKKDGKADIGLIAQDVEKVIPELVYTSETTGLKSVKYGNIVALLIEAIKEQQVEIDILKAKIK